MMVSNPLFLHARVASESSIRAQSHVESHLRIIETIRFLLVLRFLLGKLSVIYNPCTRLIGEMDHELKSGSGVKMPPCRYTRGKIRLGKNEQIIRLMYLHESHQTFFPTMNSNYIVTTIFFDTAGETLSSLLSRPC
jgi:hypothetical protein